MKATDLLKLIENSKTKSVPGELGKQTYQNDNTPNNHVKGKGMKQVTAKAGGEKRDKKPRADVGSPKKRERRSMEGPGTSARRMNEALDAKQIAGLLQGSGRDPATGNMVIVVKDINRDNRPIKIPMSDRRVYQNLLSALKSGDDNQANKAYWQLINNAGAEFSRSSFSGKDEGGMQRGSGQGGVNRGARMSDAQIDAAANKFSLANSKGSKEKRIRESGAQNSDSMGKETAAAGGPISKSASIKSPGFDKKPTADVGKVKKKEKRNMGANPAPVKDCKGGENQHKSMKKMHEAISDISNWLGTDINLVTEVSQEEMLKQLQAKAERDTQYRGGNTGELETFYLDTDNTPSCPHCGSGTDFDDASGEEGDPQTHQCLNGKCGFQFKGEFEPEGEFEEAEGDYMDRKQKMAGMKDKRPIRTGSSSTRKSPGKGYRRMHESKKKITEGVDLMSVLRSYLESALWTEEEELGDKSFSDFSGEALSQAKRDVKRFIKAAGKNLKGLNDEQIGHDLWLTRNGHGAGFWDRGLGEVGDRLSEISEKLGNKDLYLGDDGKLYFF